MAVVVVFFDNENVKQFPHTWLYRVIKDRQEAYPLALKLFLMLAFLLKLKQSKQKM